MTIPSYRSHEPLYIVVIRMPDAEQCLRAWSQECQIHAMIEGNRMKLFDHNALSLFQIRWPHGWNMVSIWDCWNKRHIWQD